MRLPKQVAGVWAVRIVLKGRTRRTALRWAEVFAWGRGPWSGTTSFLDAQGPALVDLALESVFHSIGSFGGDHLYKSEAAALASVWVTHNVALLNGTVLFEKCGDLLFAKAGVDTRNEQVGACVGRLVVAAILTAWWGIAVSVSNCMCRSLSDTLTGHGHL